MVSGWMYLHDIGEALAKVIVKHARLVFLPTWNVDLHIYKVKQKFDPTCLFNTIRNEWFIKSHKNLTLFTYLNMSVCHALHVYRG